KSQEQVYGLPNYFKDLGYTTIGIHSYDKTFYSRDKCYGRMGFDEFIGEQDMPDAVHDLNSQRQFILDSYFVDQIEKQLEKETDGSKFVFAISMENHGQFTDKYPEYEQIATCPAWDEKENGIANCYVKSVKASDEALGQLYEYVMNREKPTVVLWFGDHLPTLNDRHTVLEKAGYISTGWSNQWGKDEYYNMYRTPFVIFSNYLQDTQMQVGDYSSYMLAPVLLDYIDAPTNGYWELIKALHSDVKVYNRLITEDGEGTVKATSITDENGAVIGSTLDQLPEKSRELIDVHTLVSYDALAGKRYINELLLEKKK
ncbi:MAG: LTA synthase family protein, partial [Clostridia bacterium]|nr:LTA synthase family protein [Clostridia bacterium]